MTKTIEIEVPSEQDASDYDYISVEFEGDATIEDDTITIEGQSYGHGPYAVIEEITWKKAKHTKWENAAIAVYLSDKTNLEDIEQQIIEEYEACEPDYD